LKYDISPLMIEWDFESGAVNARYVEAQDGRTCIQMRMDLGIFQMEVEARPDGRRPHGYGTALAYYENQATTSRGPFRMSPEACGELQQEAVQFYHRYIARMHLRDFEGVMQDTLHNLHILDLVDRHAEDEDMAWDFLQFKPYTLMMHYRAEYEWYLAREGDRSRARQSLRTGLTAIRNFWRQQGEDELEEECFETQTLTELLKAHDENREPISETDRLRDELEMAIGQEDFEKAAALRDRLLAMDKGPRRAAPRIATTPPASS